MPNSNNPRGKPLLPGPGLKDRAPKTRQIRVRLRRSLTRMLLRQSTENDLSSQIGVNHSSRNMKE